MNCTRCETDGGRYEILDRESGVIETICDDCLLHWAYFEHEATEKAAKAREVARKDESDG